MEFVILGRTTLRVNGTDVPLGAAKQRAMLALLLHEVGRPVRPDVIAEHLWNGRCGVDEYRSRLHQLISRTRADLREAGLPNALLRVPSTGAYRLDLDPMMIDYHRFRYLLAQARTAAEHGDHDACVAVLVDAVNLWRDEPLADLRGPHAEPLRHHMRHSLLDAQKLLIGGQIRLGWHQAALDRLDPLIREHDLDEVLAQHWITALCALGRQDESRRYLNTFRRKFRREMHVEPAVSVPRSVVALDERPAPSPRGPSQLLTDINDFIGRADLLAQLDRLLEPSEGGATNAILITGMPGAGKTTLANHWAHRHRDRFPDGQLYLNANAYGTGPTMEPSEALGRLLDALGETERIPVGVDSRRDRFNHLLTGRRVLVIIDNVRDSTQVRPLIPIAALCTTIITSRNTLTGLAVHEGVRTITVAPMLEQESLALLARMIGVDRSKVEPESVKSLARLTGGLPLALRIVGQHVAERAKATIADLTREFGTRLLDSPDEAEHAGLHTVFTWSYTGFEPDMARMFRMLGRYPGPTIAPDAAAALLDVTELQAERLLNGLARAHFLDHDVARRYRLHDLLRWYANDRVETEETEDARSHASHRLLDWFLLSAANAVALLAPHSSPVPDLPTDSQVVPRIFGGDGEAMRWCEVERENLVAIARWAANHGFHRHAWQLPAVVHEIFDRYGSQDDLLELYELALTSARLDGHQIGEIGTLNDLGAIYFARHDYSRAVDQIEPARRLAHELGLSDIEFICTQNLATLHVKMSDAAVAVDLYRNALNNFRACGDRMREAFVLNGLAEAYRSLGRHDDAITCCNEALGIREQVGSPREQGASHATLAGLYFETQRLDLARKHCQRALDLYGRARDNIACCDVLTTLARVHHGLGRPAEASRAARTAMAMSEEIADSARRCRAMTALAEALASDGDIDAAQSTVIGATELLIGLETSEAQLLRNRLSRILNPKRQPHGNGG